MTIHLLFLIVLAALCLWILVEDIRRMEIAAIPVLALSALSVLTGVLYPLPALSGDHALAGAAIGLLMGTLTRGYIHLRVGVPAFGGADIALLAAAGGLLGPFLFGPWLMAAAALGIILTLSAPLLRRRTDVDGEELDVTPFCPALILSAAGVYIAALLGWVPAWPPA